RPYQTSSPASRIHWPALARGHGMMERRLRMDMDARPLVVLDTRGPAGEDAVDEAVRAAASLALHLARAGGCALLLPGERRATTGVGSWPTGRRPPRPAPSPRPRAVPLLAAPLARIVAFAALALFCLEHWMALVAPTAGDRGLVVLVVTLAGAGALLRLDGR